MLHRNNMNPDFFGKVEPMFREWINAVATGFSFYTGLNAWHEMPARQADFIRKAQQKATKATEPAFVEAFKVAAD